MDRLFIDGEEFTDKVRMHRVFDFDYSTITLFRCTKKQYAEDLKKGKIKFSQPHVWIDEEKSGNKGLGDDLEGVFLSTDWQDQSDFIKHLKENKNFEHFDKSFKTFFRRKQIKNLYCLCLYGLKDTSFNIKKVDKLRNTYNVAKIPKSYFNDFANGVTKESYDLNSETRNAVAFIFNPKLFFNRIREFFIKLGIQEKDIIISPVEYINKYDNLVNLVPYPHELLLKDLYFSYQSEIRVIINSQSDKLIKYMNEHNNIIDIGDNSDIIQVFDYYFDDMFLRKNGNTMLFTLPHVETFDLGPVNWDKSPLLLLIRTFIEQSKDPNLEHSAIDDIKDAIYNRYHLSMFLNNNTLYINGNNDDVNKFVEDYKKELKEEADNTI